jgi:hypothetical protein
MMIFFTSCDGNDVQMFASQPQTKLCQLLSEHLLGAVRPVFIDGSKDVGLEVNTERIKYIFKSLVFLFSIQ